MFDGDAFARACFVFFVFGAGFGVLGSASVAGVFLLGAVSANFAAGEDGLFFARVAIKCCKVCSDFAFFECALEAA